MGLTEAVVCPHCESTLECWEVDWHTTDEEADDPFLNGVVACGKCQKVLGVTEGS